jgi:DNA repair exonuclease SbcCD nuclease subunit
MKTVFIGDIHGRSIWKEIVEQEKPDRVIFVGDYFDSFDIPGIDQIHNFKEIIHFKKTSGIEVVLLVGNHDYHYMDMGETYSGFQPALKFDIGQLLKENMEHLQMAYSFDNFLCTHAGVSSVFMNDNFRGSWNCDNLVEKLNETFKYSPFIFKFNGEIGDASASINTIRSNYSISRAGINAAGTSTAMIFCWNHIVFQI